MGSQGSRNSRWAVFDDYAFIEDITVPSLLDPTAFASPTWPPHLSFPASTSLGMIILGWCLLPAPRIDVCSDDSSHIQWFCHRDSMFQYKNVENGGSFENSDGLKEIASRKSFVELSSILDPGRPPKMDKVIILGDAARMVSQLRGETQKLKELEENLLEKINELKVEKNELRDEKQRLKTKKEKLEVQVKASSTQSGVLPHPLAIPATFCAPGQVIGNKPVPFIGYPEVSMWEFMPPSSFDASQDHVLCPPVA